ncbi:unnamed protein product [Gordionus sp. m RMFG-2023]|uniref:transcription factor Adf-1-like n=1 Tax=Gordionus sp. m RMFG-2023 TaxID=3053472 RepID=UPI0030DE99D5
MDNKDNIIINITPNTPINSSNNEIKASNDLFVKSFISMVKSRPAIWDPSDKDYSNNEKKSQDWVDVCDICHVDILLAKSKWKNLRDNFVKESKKDRLPTSRWKFFDSLSFLSKSLDLRKKKSLNFLEISVFKSNDSILPNVTTPIITKISNSLNETSNSLNETNDHKNEKALSNNISSLLNVEKILKKIIETDDDEDRIFVLSLVGEIKKLPESLKIQAKISLLTTLKDYQDYQNLSPKMN